MAVFTSLIDNAVAQTSRQTATLTKTITLPTTGVNNGDNVQIITLPLGQPRRIVSAYVTTAGSLGAGATVTLQVNRGGTRTSITTATAAGGVSQGASYTLAGVPFDALGGDVLELLVGGANVSASANVTIDVVSNIRG